MAEENPSNESKPMKSGTRVQRLKEKCKGTQRISFIFFCTLHVTKIVIATVFYNKCPVEPEIPKYLLAMGIIGIFTKLISLFHDYLTKRIKLNFILSFISTIELTIFIVASYYIYRNYQPNYDPLTEEKYCNKTLYVFSFIYITIIYGLLLLSIVMVGCFILALVVLDKYEVEDIELNTENITTFSPSEEQARKESSKTHI